MGQIQVSRNGFSRPSALQDGPATRQRKRLDALGAAGMKRSEKQFDATLLEIDEIQSIDKKFLADFAAGTL